MFIDLSDLSVTELRAIKQILVAGVPSRAETSEFAQDRKQLCHKSPPKGYPKDKSDYGDSACYRYPLNTKARCLAAWRYVHHADNKSILGDKFKSVESKVKNYAKKHYDLDLKVGESGELDWEQAFLEYYDSETMGERCDDIVLEPNNGENNMEDSEKITALEKEVGDLKGNITTLENDKEALATDKSDLESKASQVDDLTKELGDQKQELEDLRTFKQTVEEAAERAEKVKNIKSKLEEAGVEANFEDEAEADYWLGMSDEVLDTTISKLSELKKGAKASASKTIKVPNLLENETDAVDTVREGLKEMKNSK